VKFNQGAFFMSKPTALVTGASGLVGSYLLRHLLAQGNWNIIAVSRRKPDIPGDYRHIAVDLLDRSDCEAKLGSLADISHIFYLAYTERADVAESTAANTAMLVNLVNVVERASPALLHIHLSEGSKWYGNHLGPYKTPSKEDDPRHMPPNFYYDQHDFLAKRQIGQKWTWSTVRPHAVCGLPTGGPMNLAMAIAVYASVCKALGLPLAFPGKPGAYTALYQCTDAALLAQGIEWMATDAQSANQSFNITNGDLIRWEHLWPKFAEFFGMDVAPPRRMALSRSMADKAPIWERIVSEHGLVPTSFEAIASWGYPESVFDSDYDIVSDTGKARRFGFHAAVDTEEMFLRMFAEFRQARLIP
jgi:nucleoside-diphosphate-sugar epimerase